MTSFHDPNKRIREPDPELMKRLATGEKANVTEKDYK